MLEEASQRITFEAIAELHSQDVADLETKRQIRELIKHRLEANPDDLTASDLRH
jgi:ubiquinone biosynthesis protein COQ9